MTTLDMRARRGPTRTGRVRDRQPSSPPPPTDNDGGCLSVLILAGLTVSTVLAALGTWLGWPA